MWIPLHVWPLTLLSKSLLPAVQVYQISCPILPFFLHPYKDEVNPFISCAKYDDFFLFIFTFSHLIWSQSLAVSMIETLLPECKLPDDA